MKTLGKRCSDTGPHTHETVIGLSGTGEKRSVESQEFPRLMAKVYAAATRSAWLHGARPKPQALHLHAITLDQLMADVAMEPPVAPPSASPAARMDALSASPAARVDPSLGNKSPAALGPRLRPSSEGGSSASTYRDPGVASGAVPLPPP